MEENKYNCLKLSQQLCFPLYACARETIKLYTPHLDKLGLTYTQYITMMVLWERKSLTAKELGRILFLDSGTLTPMLKKMEGKGLLTRKRSEMDERNLIVTITDAGDALKDQALEIPEMMTRHINLETEEIAVLYRSLYKMLERAESGK
ncbi:MAG: MarR family transcriptional regulator [Oscillospiraceae bacterium]|nr:MarR family transcriptional regulator [Oscillospiraceae bacterium]